MENHFTSRIISNKDGKIWFNNGNTTRGKRIKESHLFIKRTHTCHAIAVAHPKQVEVRVQIFIQFIYLFQFSYDLLQLRNRTVKLQRAALILRNAMEI